MRLTIIPIDSFVAVDGNSSRKPLDLSSCNIPSNIHALQWYETKGWVEFNDDNDPFTPRQPNEQITELPTWATACVEVWNSWTSPQIISPDVPADALPATEE
jgi:hypothetical protein